jgi:hypothetical protein
MLSGPAPTLSQHWHSISPPNPVFNVLSRPLILTRDEAEEVVKDATAGKRLHGISVWIEVIWQFKQRNLSLWVARFDLSSLFECARHLDDSLHR